MGSINGIEVAVGQAWRTRSGAKAVITEVGRSGAYPTAARVTGWATTQSFRADGRWGVEDTSIDLIELVSQPAAPYFGIGEDPAFEHNAEKAGWTRYTAPVPELAGKVVEFTMKDGSVTPPMPASEVRHSDEIISYRVCYAQDAIQVTEEVRAGDDHESLTFHPIGADAGINETTEGPAIDPGRTNPKDAVGDKKLALHLLSPIAEAHWAIGQYAGMLKYGAWNWRAAGVRASIYISALRRHLAAYQSGEEFDPTDGSHHLGNIMACAAILLEAREIGKLVDDRPPSFSHRPTYVWAEDRMAQLKIQYSDKSPRHYSIGDTAEVGGALPAFDRKKADDTEGGAA